MNLQKTAAWMESERENGRFDSYAILVRKDKEKQFLFSPDCNADTYFDVASMGKVLVTSTLVLKAASLEKLRLTDHLDVWFDDVPEEKRTITIQQLLTHTSGIVRTQFPDRIADSGRDAVAEFILRTPLAFQPGTDYQYSCNGYVLLGYIVEKAFGKPLDCVYFEQLARPLGLQRVAFHIAAEEPNAAVCYRWEHMGARRADDEIIYTLHEVAGNGGEQMALSTIMQFCEAVLRRDERLYAKKFFDLAERDYTPDFAEGRGLGYLMVDARYRQTGNLFPSGSFGHCGHTGQCFYLNRAQGLYVIVLTNATRCLNRQNHFRGYDYRVICEMRRTIHNLIAEDFGME